MSRHFFALWPDEDTRENIAAVCQQLPEKYGRVITPQNLHITLAFLGSIDSEQALRLREGAASARGTGFTLTLERLGWWKRPGVAWIAPELTPAALLGLVGSINHLIQGHGIVPDSRLFQPHLTIARKVKRAPEHVEFAPIKWKISSFCLARSNTLPAGAVYEVIETWPLSSA